MIVNASAKIRTTENVSPRMIEEKMIPNMGALENKIWPRVEPIFCAVIIYKTILIPYAKIPNNNDPTISKLNVNC
jgi:hypothetical protein